MAPYGYKFSGAIDLEGYVALHARQSGIRRSTWLSSRPERLLHLSVITVPMGIRAQRVPCFDYSYNATSRMLDGEGIKIGLLSCAYDWH
ncbi:hypothetical protein MJO29_015874 [Puccinia striiformis f. sp. tritici]|nr:hypothetical protein MJO29_015874 [Puccinia striiformis f. sp. tritici]